MEWTLNPLPHDNATSVSHLQLPALSLARPHLKPTPKQKRNVKPKKPRIPTLPHMFLTTPSRPLMFRRTTTPIFHRTFAAPSTPWRSIFLSLHQQRSATTPPLTTLTRQRREDSDNDDDAPDDAASVEISEDAVELAVDELAALTASTALSIDSQFDRRESVRKKPDFSVDESDSTTFFALLSWFSIRDPIRAREVMAHRRPPPSTIRLHRRQRRTNARSKFSDDLGAVLEAPSHKVGLPAEMTPTGHHRFQTSTTASRHQYEPIRTSTRKQKESPKHTCPCTRRGQ